MKEKLRIPTLVSVGLIWLIFSLLNRVLRGIKKLRYHDIVVVDLSGKRKRRNRLVKMIVPDKRMIYHVTDLKPGGKNLDETAG